MKKYLLLFLLAVSLNAATQTWKVRDSDDDTTFISSDGEIYVSGDTLFIKDIVRITFSNDTIILYPLGIYANDTLDLNTDFVNFLGKILAGSFGSPLDVGSARKYGVEIHYSGDNNDVTGLRSRAQAVTTDAPTKTVQGAEIQASNNDGINVSVLNGLIAEALSKSTSTGARIGTLRAGLFGMDLAAKDTITDAFVVHIRAHTRNASGEGTIDGDSYILLLENEAVGGNGQAFDAGIYFKGTNLSGGNKAFKYGIDFYGADYDSAEIRLSDGTLFPGGYRSESRVDTFTSMYIYQHLVPEGIGLVTNGGGLVRFRAYATFNSQNDEGLCPLQLLADSGYIDSIQLVYYWGGTPPDTDTFFVFIADSAANYSYIYLRTNTPIDTIVAADIVKDNWGEVWTLDVGIGYNLGCLDGSIFPYFGGFYYNDDGGGQLTWGQLIVYWEAFYKR